MNWDFIQQSLLLASIAWVLGLAFVGLIVYVVYCQSRELAERPDDWRADEWQPNREFLAWDADRDIAA